jgi:hypothetical protein
LRDPTTACHLPRRSSGCCACSTSSEAPRHGQDYFADWVDGDRAKIADGDADGASHFLQAFGGIGSLNDVVFQPRDADKELRALAEEAFQLQLGLAAD